MNPGVPLKATIGDGLWRSFPRSLPRTSKTMEAGHEAPGRISRRRIGAGRLGRERIAFSMGLARGCRHREPVWGRDQKVLYRG